MNVPYYLLNVALHGAILSVVVSLFLALLRRPGHRATAAIPGLLAVAVLPWISTLRPDRLETTAPLAMQSNPLPTWTIATLPADMAEPVERKMLGTVMGPAARESLTFPQPYFVIAGIWATGAAIGICLLGIGGLRVRVWRQTLLVPGAAEWKAILAVLPASPDRHVFRISPTAVSPCVTGFLQPRIVLPQFLFASGPPDGLGWAVRHEMSHWRAGDSRWVVFFALIRCVHWWNPLVHRLVGKWAEAREEICDLAATSTAKNRADYGGFLITMAQQITGRPPLAVAMAKRAHVTRLKRRVVSLLDAGVEAGRPAGVVFVATVSVLLMGCAATVSSVKIGEEEYTGPVAHSAKSQLPETVSNPPPAAAQIPATDEAKPTGQVKVNSRFITSTRKPTWKHGDIMNDEEMQKFMREMAEIKGTGLTTAPNIMMRMGQAGTIEIIRTEPGIPEGTIEERLDGTSPFWGIVISPKVVLDGGGARLDLNTHYRFAPGEDHVQISEKPAGGIPWDRLRSARAEMTIPIQSGQTVCSDFGEIEPGVYLQGFTKVEAIDKTGRLLEHFGAVRKLPSADVRGKLKLTGELVEIPLKEPRPPGMGLVIGLTPSDPDVAAGIRNTPGAKVRALPQVEIPFNDVRTPWQEFPGLNVSAISSEDYKEITIESHAVGNGEENEFPNRWEYLPSGQLMNFGIRSKDPNIERRLLITIEAGP